MIYWCYVIKADKMSNMGLLFMKQHEAMQECLAKVKRRLELGCLVSCAFVFRLIDKSEHDGKPCRFACFHKDSAPFTSETYASYYKCHNALVDYLNLQESFEDFDRVEMDNVL